MPDFMIYALAACILLAFICAPLGCFLVWRRMAFFGDVLAHAALPGLAFGLAFHLSPTLMVFGVGVIIALLLSSQQGRFPLPKDTLLGVIGPAFLSIGLIALTFIPGARADLMSYLFGDILALRPYDLGILTAAALACVTLLAWLWKPLLALSMHEEMAMLAGYTVKRVETLYHLMLALAIALGIQLVGVLLMSALLLIPAASARALSRTPFAMAMMATILSIIGSALGLFTSLYTNIPSGPAVVVALTLLFCLTRINSYIKT